MSLYSPQGWIFIHVRKTGGTTVRNLLLGPLVRYLTTPHDMAYYVRRHMAEREALGLWNMAFKFAFVRDPYTWVESMRRHAIAQEDHPLRADAYNISEWPARLAQACENREQTTDGTFCFQSEMVMDRGTLIVDRLCRFENYHDEVRWLGNHLGIDIPERLPHEGLHDVPQAPIDGQYRLDIAKYFSDDFKALGYEP